MMDLQLPEREVTMPEGYARLFTSLAALVGIAAAASVPGSIGRILIAMVFLCVAVTSVADRRRSDRLGDTIVGGLSGAVVLSWPMSPRACSRCRSVIMGE